jgi:hypothetical protein
MEVRRPGAKRSVPIEDTKPAQSCVATSDCARTRFETVTSDRRLGCLCATALRRARADTTAAPAVSVGPSTPRRLHQPRGLNAMRAPPANEDHTERSSTSACEGAGPPHGIRIGWRTSSIAHDGTNAALFGGPLIHSGYANLPIFSLSLAGTHGHRTRRNCLGSRLSATITFTAYSRSPPNLAHVASR